MNVTKRDGSKEELSTDKIVKSLSWATDGLSILSEDIVSAANLHLFDGISTESIHDTMIKVTDDMSELRSDKIEYDTVSARLLMQKVYREAFAGNKPHSLKYMIEQNVELGVYDSNLLSKYSSGDIVELFEYIDFNRNFTFTKAGLQSLIDKYMIKYDNKLVEDPQTMFMAISMAVFIDYKGSDRLSTIKDLYDALATFKISFPTPMMAGLRTGSYNIASCVLVNTGDSIESWTSTFSAIVEHTCASAGLGVDASMVASIGDKVKDGKISHSGKVPLYKAMDALVQTSTQMNRRGAMVAHTFFCDPEIETILSLKSPKLETAKRINDLKHSIKINQYLMDRVINGEDIHLISPRVGKLMYENMHDNEMFAALYEKHVETGSYSSKINGRELMEKLLEARFENGVYYLFFADNVNDASPFKETISQSNLCVTGDTKILTKDFGYVEIEKVVGQELECWNGEEWSTVPIVKTGENQKFMKVTLNNGVEIKATPYHKWYTKSFGKYGGARKKDVEKRTHELEIGDALVKFDLEPITHGNKHLVCAYENGFFSADGSNEEYSKRIVLYEDKMLLMPYFCNYDSAISNEDARSGQRRTVLRYGVKNESLKDKFFIPDNSYSVKSRLDWLAGYFDGDGTLTSNNGAESIQAVSIEKEFLLDLQLMLQELGINSFVSKRGDAGYRSMPKNDGTGEHKEYWCKDTWRIMIAGSELQKLLNIGYKANRVMPSVHKYNRSATRFARVVSIEELDTVEDSYCGYESKRNKLMFNGQLTGNCHEISLPTKALSKNDNSPDIAVCVLSNINMGTVDKSELKHYTKLLVYALNEVIHKQDHPTGQANAFIEQYAALGIGVSNGAYFFAKNGVRYGTSDALVLVDEYMESFMYYLIMASAEYSKEFDACAPKFHKSKYSNWNYVAGLSKRVCPENMNTGLYWQDLADLVIENGMANLTLSSIPPSESSSLVGNMTSSIEPIKEPLTIKDSKTGQIKQYAPEALKLVDKYDYAFDTKNMTERYIKTVAVFQKWVDQGISTQTFYNPDLYENSKVPMQVIWDDIKLAKEKRLKTLYYNNVFVADNENQEEECENCTV